MEKTIDLTKEEDLNKMSQKFILITENNYDKFDKFYDLTGMGAKKDNVNTFIEYCEDIIDEEDYVKLIKNEKIYTSKEVYDKGYGIFFIFGNPSSLYVESFKNYMEMWYNFK